VQKLFRGLVCLMLCASGAAAADAVQGKNVEFGVHSGHFENNDSGLEGAASFLALTDRAAFDKVFGVGAVMGRQNFVREDAFRKQMVVAVIRRGGSLVDYKVNRVAADGDTLHVQYTAKAQRAAGATFSSPLIVSVAKGDYKSVVFTENGKKVETVKVGR
jgi:hypothetical protein